MADYKLKAILEAEDNASAKIKGVGLSFGQMTGAVALGGLAVKGATMAFGFLTDTIKGSIDASKAEEVSNVKVNAILQTLTGSLQEHKKAVDDASKSAMKLGFDDEDASESMAKLLQITKNTETAQTAQGLAMDVARFKGIDLGTATDAITKAYMGNTKILKQLGIELPDNASKEEVLGLIHDKVAGQAEAYGNTTAGAQEKFKVAMENLQESIGKGILPMITRFFNTVSGFVTGDKLQGWLEQIQKLFTQYIKPAIETYIIPAFNKLKEAIEPHIPLLTNIAKVIGGAVGLTLLGVIVVTGEAIKVFAKVFDVLADSIEWVIKQIQRVIGFFKDVSGAISSFKGAVGGAFGSAWDKVKGTIGLATGGMVMAGKAYTVGEHGSELFIPDVSGQIRSHESTGGGSVTVNFNNPTVRSDADLQMILDEVKRSLGRDNLLARMGAS